MGRADAVFVSDVHLSDAHPGTTDAFLGFIDAVVVGCTERLFILGDLFDAWPGDDDLDDRLAARIAGCLRAVADSGIAVAFVAGNRDFLVGEAFARASGLMLLPDPWQGEVGGVDLLLSHGDALCTDDTDYQDFRRMVREPAWRHAFLGRSLAERRAIVAGVRQQSETAKQDKAAEIMDVNAGAVEALFDAHPDAILIHGHTHRPAHYPHGPRSRWVLPDWDGDVKPPRGGGLVLRDGVLAMVDAY